MTTLVHPYFKKARRLAPRAAGAGPWTLPELCAAYRLPTGLVSGSTIAIVELRGGWVESDLAAFFKSIGQPMPTVVDVSVDGTTNTPDPSADSADGEVALDVEAAGAVFCYMTSKAASIRVYWAQDIAAAVRAATADKVDVISISWGADEAAWGLAAADDMEAAAAAAVAAGIPIFAASGDNDSGDGGPTPANVDLPASAPSVVGCGGTSKTREDESVWNNNPGQSNGEGTGGGYSTIFPMPSWQVTGGAPVGNASVPGAARFRMVPDIAANADPETGYEIYFHGQAQVIGGTSAVAPLYAGIFAALGAKLGAVGPKLWANHGDFVDITSGDNGTYKAQIGPDPCTGLGAPNGLALAATFTSAPVPAPKPTPTPAPVAPKAPTATEIETAVKAAIAAIPSVTGLVTKAHAESVATDAIKKMFAP